MKEFRAEDRLFMRRAISLAAMADPSLVAPNPHVGAVLVHQGRVIGEGFHSRCGEAHAEVRCLDSVADKERCLIPYSTLYVTLEPCSHTGRTPSCAKRLVAEQISRVVVGCEDPNPLVAGRGIRLLEEAGIEVVVGVEEEACHSVARVFMCNQINHRPYITLKWAMSRDGFMERADRSPSGEPTRFSSPYTQMLVHKERSEHLAILVGYRTLLADHARLDNRLWGWGSPVPYVIDPDGKSLALLEEYPEAEKWRVAVCSPMAQPTRPQIIPLQREHLLPKLLEEMLKQGHTSLLVEGGARTLASFLADDLYDRIRVEQAPFDLGKGLRAPDIPPDVQPMRKVVLDGLCIREYEKRCAM